MWGVGCVCSIGALGDGEQDALDYKGGGGGGRGRRESKVRHGQCGEITTRTCKNNDKKNNNTQQKLSPKTTTTTTTTTSNKILPLIQYPTVPVYMYSVPRRCWRGR